MKFVPVPGTKALFCIHETRKGDYAKFAAEISGVDDAWRKPQTREGISIGSSDDHPVVKVSWSAAQAFCLWLGKKDGHAYRLPTDREWSHAVGIATQESATATPEVLHEKLKGEFPWGMAWPPPKNAGNYADISALSGQPARRIIQGYDDGFPTTAPVMSFPANKLGLYDLGGNVFEWCDDWWNTEQKARVVRGACWNSDSRGLLSSTRHHWPPNDVNIGYGFRVVLEVATSAAAPVTSPPAVAQPVPRIPASPAASALTTATKDAPFVNSLGMKFVAVPGTKVLFCIHETRRQDYAAYAQAVPGVDESWKNQAREGVPCGHELAHPVVGVGLNDSQGFCTWISQKEGLPYRLPTEAEWSHAVGIGPAEAAWQSSTP
jgi:formylglycine-generating enzyme required for sulfatase activity